MNYVTKALLLRTASVSIVVVTLLLTACDVARSALIASDSFATNVGGDAYTNASRLYGQSPTVGTTGFNGAVAWGNGNNQTTAVNYPNTGGLSHVLMSGTAVAGHYQSAAVSSSGTAPRHVSRAISSFTATDGVYYMSVLMRKTTTDAGLAGKAGLLGLGSNQSHADAFSSTTGVYLGINEGNVSLLAGGSFTDVVAAANMPQNEVFLGLLEIDFSTTGADSVTVRVFDGAGALVGSQMVTGLNLDASMGRLAAVTGPSYTTEIQLDEFRFGTTLADVMVVPEPMSVLFMLLGCIGIVLFQLRSTRDR